MAPKMHPSPKQSGLISPPFWKLDSSRERGMSTANGAKPADLPVQYPTKLQLVINHEIAKALNLIIP